MAKRNFLLGKGERLVANIKGLSGPVDKAPPYTFEEAKARLEPMIQFVAAQVAKLPSDACPDDLAVAAITLNPEYIAKSYFPSELLRSAGLEPVGSKAKTMKPSQRSKGREPIESFTTQLFVKGTRQDFRRWANSIDSMNEFSTGATQIQEIEEVSFPTADEKVRDINTGQANTIYEVVLHIDEDAGEAKYLDRFKSYLQKRKITPEFQHRFYAGGLCFVEMEAPTADASFIAEFSLVRVVRTMPSLRLLRPAIRTTTTNKKVKVEIPDVRPLDSNIKVAIFDGGIPDGHPIMRWAVPHDVQGIGRSVPELLDHGVGVTSAYLFGHLDSGTPLPQPYSYVDHYRILDDIPGENPYELYEILDRIMGVLNSKSYDFINLSLGPQLPIDDDEVHAWTAVLDKHLSNGNVLATIAVGNDGEGDPSIQANRIQVPADCVNALGVGACDVPDAGWSRAPYSSVGPGRSPGIIKPDLVEFGGSLHRPFVVLDAIDGYSLSPTGGTSFAAPSILRLGAGVRAHFGNSLNALALRTLLVHCSEPTNHPKTEVGFGRVARTLEDIVVCPNGVVRVVFQGKISASKVIRTPIPVPLAPLSGMVTIKATLCYATAVDPHHPENYTRSGLEIFFRPNKNKMHVNQDGSSSTYPETKPFFSLAQKEYRSEQELRRDAWKWENCMHGTKQFRPSTLLDPVFDIHYMARLEGHNDTRSQEIQYALVVTLEAPRVTDIYDQVVRRYATILEQLTPIIDIPVRV